MSTTQNQWQQIETAPKDETFLVYHPTFVNKVWVLSSAEQSLNGFTHWMPLPAPPAAASPAAPQQMECTACKGIGFIKNRGDGDDFPCQFCPNGDDDDYGAAPQQPLTDAEIDAIMDQQWGKGLQLSQYQAHRAASRAIERAVLAKIATVVAPQQSGDADGVKTVDGGQR
jgi:hypothetical protein